MTDYWLSKLFFDLQSPPNLARWKEDPDAVMADYPLEPEVRKAVLENDLETLAPRVNAYLFRFYMTLSGMSDEEVLPRLRAMKKPAAAGAR